MTTESRYIVGIDLGTTNSAICFVDTELETRTVQVFPVPQLVAPHQIEARETLPSFHYEMASGEFAKDAFELAWDRQPTNFAVGTFARDQGVSVPGRLISSAKSWLCHPGVDRTADLLPWHGADDVDRLSPVEASSRYIAHLRQAWDAVHPEFPLAEQDVVLTLPASFDEVARELTVQAAQQANLPRVVLIEEPQAAFYAWIHRHAENWESQVSPGQKILVCDVGGGTSDFTLIKVRRGDGDKVQFHRVAVGQHLILGGDNLDLALAHHLEQQLTGDGKLQPRQWDVLVRSCRQVKETLLGENPPDSYTVNVPGTGSGLIGGALQVEITREEIQQVLIDGFLPLVALDETPQTQSSGFREFGLPYASDPAITKHLAAFLSVHRNVTVPGEELDASADHDPARPDIVLFNGGLFASPLLQDRVQTLLQNWFRTETDSDWQPLILENDRLDLAVARGAAYYGLVRRGEGVRIAAGLARTYYIGIEQTDGSPGALCLVPAGVEPGQEIDLTARTFTLRLSEPVEFPLYVSSTRLTDKPGEVVQVDAEQMKALPPIRTVLKTSRKSDDETIAVQLHARLTEIGTLDLWCGELEGSRRWRLQFDVRSATQTDITAHTSAAEGEGIFDETKWQQAQQLIAETFDPDNEANAKPSGLVKGVAKTLELSRQEWPTSLLRNIWEELMTYEAGRRRSQNHESRWLNLLGFSLIPGYGYALDDWRVSETWKTLQGRLIHNTPQCRAEWWILWRRVAGGLESGQQQALAEPMLGSLRQTHKQITTGKGKGGSIDATSHEAAEIWRLLGSLELLSIQRKTQLGQMIVDFLPKKKMAGVRPAMLWTLGRVGARVPLYGSLNSVLPAESVAPWLTELMKQEPVDPIVPLVMMQLARKTEDRYRDVSASVRDRVLNWLDLNDAPEHFFELVKTGGTLDAEEQGLVFGESLPSGLRLR